MQNRITIKDIAEETGVSRGTIDRVLNNRGGVAEVTREKVLAKIKELNYKPNRIAQSLALQKNYDIRMIMPSEPKSFYSQVKAGIKAAERELEDYGFKISILPSTGADYPEEELLAKAVEEGADGLVIMPINTALMKEPINQVVSEGIPVLTIVSDVADSQRFCYIGLNNLKGGRLAGELMGKFLNGQGKVAVILNYTFNSCNQKRTQGFCDVIKKDFPDIGVVSIQENYDREEKAYDLTCQILKDYPDLKGIFVTNVCSSGVARALVDLKKNKQVRLIGFDITEEIIHFLKERVLYATICQEPFVQGYRAVRFIYEYIILGKKPERDNILILPKVIFVETLDEENEIH